MTPEYILVQVDRTKLRKLLTNYRHLMANADVFADEQTLANAWVMLIGIGATLDCLLQEITDTHAEVDRP